MDEIAYARARAVANPAPCVFEKALLAGCAQCELAQRRALAEREAVACPSPTARTNCATLAALLRERATFTLRLPRPGEPLAHARAMQLQCGGLQGLREVLAAPDADVHRMIGLAHARSASLLDLAWDGIVRAIAAWQPRRRAAPPRP
jgi:hypothetical protein